DRSRKLLRMIPSSGKVMWHQVLPAEEELVFYGGLTRDAVWTCYWTDRTEGPPFHLQVFRTELTSGARELMGRMNLPERRHCEAITDVGLWADDGRSAHTLLKFPRGSSDWRLTARLVPDPFLVGTIYPDPRSDDGFAIGPYHVQDGQARWSDRDELTEINI